jgi:GTP-binding protein HflX
VVVSARTGEGLAELVSAIEANTPHPPVEVDALVPYARGDLVARVHEIGEVITCDHTADGTLLRARVPAGLASVLAEFAPTP